jgi:hypothetical protein
MERFMLRRWHLHRPGRHDGETAYVVIYTGGLSLRIVAGAVAVQNTSGPGPHFEEAIVYTTDASTLAELAACPPRTHTAARERADELPATGGHGAVWAS